MSMRKIKVKVAILEDLSFDATSYFLHLCLNLPSLIIGRGNNPKKFWPMIPGKVSGTKTYWNRTPQLNVEKRNCREIKSTDTYPIKGKTNY